MALGDLGCGGLDDLDGAAVDGLEEVPVEGAGALLGVVGLDFVGDGLGGVEVNLEAAGRPEHELDDALDKAGKAGAFDGAVGVGQLVAGDGPVVALDGDGDDAAGILGRVFLDAAEFQEGGLEARVEGRHKLEAVAGAIMGHGRFSLSNGCQTFSCWPASAFWFSLRSTVSMPSGASSCQAPRVKSGTSTGAPSLALEISVSSARTDHWQDS